MGPMLAVAGFIDEVMRLDWDMSPDMTVDVWVPIGGGAANWFLNWLFDDVPNKSAVFVALLPAAERLDPEGGKMRD